MTKVSPSLLSADFGNLSSDIQMLNESDADMLHIDVMDGVFVPNISFGFPVMQAIAKHARKPLDVHLMIVDPGRYVSQVRDCGSAIMNVHFEACTHLNRVVQHIRQAGMKAAVTLNPATPVAMLEDIIDDVDMVLLMSVNPGFAAQKFIQRTVEKVRQLKALIEMHGATAEIEVDGGINLETGAQVVAAGADILVAGNYVFGAQSPKEAITKLSNL
ncbi:MAG: ribulose-phosphate 3-epimerase [Firmicutes bacterium]|nr:ribulose-phosphate 3-epimerase [Bacillota bacterium]MCM1401549.1 ribulose-phosphate 3-epimerase [Bacteroides sp.]MCM1476595.1 ribulose-phosphate 3-epimerase [Bacteroides sp.]